METQLGKVELTDRGFEIIEFTDHYGEKCSLQQSSIALAEQPGAGAIWLGIKPDRMHLNVDQVILLIEVLSTWVDTGSFVKYETPPDEADE